MNKEDYYINLILNKCVSFEKSDSLFISYYVYNENFVQKLIKKIEKTHIKDIYLECIDPFYEHELLSKLTLKEIEKSEYFDCSIYNDYAKKKAAFIFFTSPIPGLMNDIDEEKLALVSKIKSSTKQYFIKQETQYNISWTIVPLYNMHWEKSLGINNLEDVLYDICLVNKNAIKNWEKQIKKSIECVKKLNDLKLDFLHFENSLGTDLTVGLPENYAFEGVGNEKILMNLPSYEVFTSPNRQLINGRVYNSRPLYFNDALIDNFYLEFKDGKISKFGAKKGKKVLQSIMNTDEGASYLGEVALVEKDSPISKTGIVFKNTLLDENAACHLALGRGFGDGTDEELRQRGINLSQIHVDFMIGTSDMKVTGIKGDKKIVIMKNGKFVL
ncbi:MAG: aminopeptidase [Firmicutes bacterium]|nr:aminopeptidase [Bacillota bacterium]